MKGNIYTLIISLLICSIIASDPELNETESYFLSPHGLGRTAQVDEALNKITSQIRVKATTYNVSGVTYILSNIVIGTDYNDGKQNITIPAKQLVKVTGGRIEFTYKFNYTKIENRNNFTGYAYGSVLSDPLTYSKGFGFNDGFMCWVTKGVENLTLNNTMKLKRMEPFNQTDASNIQDMLNNATTNIDPVNIKKQIVPVFNQIFPLALNESLNHEVYGQNVNYTFHSIRGDMKMNVQHEVYGFGIDPEDGFFRYFLTKIEGYPKPDCNVTVPKKHQTFDVYGGSQNFYSTCFYEYVVGYVHSNGWLDTVLDQHWETNAFQFYAGDLFDLINNLHLTFSPRSILDGYCEAQKDGLRFFSNRQFDSNTYTLDVTYKCTMKGTNKDRVETPILKFTSKNKFYIQAGVTTKTLTFKIVMAEIVNLTFQSVGSYFVGNVELALWKANEALKTLINTFTFGNNFPTITREYPKVLVSTEHVLYYDPSHYNEEIIIDS